MSTTEPTPAQPRAPRARRCNADYRWTVPKVEAFLRALGECGKVAEAARAVGMGRQSAYRLKARLADPRFQQTFELARRRGRMAREAARAEARARASQSEWGAPGLAAYDCLRGGDPAAQGDAPGAQGDGSGAQGYARNAQGDGSRTQGDTRSAQGYALAPRRPRSAAQGDGNRPQGDGFSGKATF